MVHLSSRSRARGLIALLGPVLVTGVLLTSSTGTASAAVDQPLPTITDPPPFGCTSSPDGRYKVCMNDPASTDPAQQEPVLPELTRLTKLTQSGDTIRIAMFNWWYKKNGQSFDDSKMQEFTAEVIAAKNRGVTVQVVLDDHSDPAENTELNGMTQPWDELEAALGSSFVSCGTDGNDDSRCLINPAANTGINHNKLSLFNISGTKYSVVSSDNFGAKGMYDMYQNAVEVVGDDKLYEHYYAYWDKLKNNNWGTWTTANNRTENGSLNPTSGVVETKGYVYPHPEFADSVANILGGVTACPSSGNRKIWLAFPNIDKARLDANGGRLQNLLTKLADPQGMKCSVKLLTQDNNLNASTRTALQNTKAEIVDVPCLHSKYLIVDATSEDMNGNNPAPRELVWTGSSNLGDGSAWTAANSNILVEQHDVVRKYVSNFTAMWNRNYQPSVIDPACGE